MELSETEVKTICLTFLIFLINIFIYGSDNLQNYYVVIHLYYALIALSGRYDNRPGQFTILALTTIINFIYLAFVYNWDHFTVSVMIYPFISLCILQTIQKFKTKETEVKNQFLRTDQDNRDLEKRIRDMSTLFDVSASANSAHDLESFFQQIIKILANRMGLYQAHLNIYDKDQQNQYLDAAFGLTEAEIRDRKQIDVIQEKVLKYGRPIGVPHKWMRRGDDSFPFADSVESKNPIAFWCLPLIVDEKVVGTLAIDKGSDEFSAEDELRILTVVASITAQRVKIQQMIDSLVQSERLATLGKMATTVAHEVRNPLGGIRGAAQLLQLEENFDANSRDYIDVILKEVDRLNRVIEQLLTFGKSQAVNFELCDLKSLVFDVLKVCDPELKQHQVEVKQNYQQYLPKVKVNPEAIEQILLNLFRNAIESIENDGTLTINATFDLEKSVIELRIEDTGRGIHPEITHKLFDPFYTTKPKGTGLGLAISQQIIEDHNGTIEVDVTSPKGAAFLITMPI